MKIFGKLESYLYTALASVVMVYAAKHPILHDPALWLLGVIGHSIGVASAQPPAAPPLPAQVPDGSVGA